MRLSVLAPVIILLAALPLRAEEADDDEGRPPVLNAATLKGDAPKIDAVLDDPAWKDAAAAGEFRLKEGSRASGKTRLLVTRDATTLYIGIECFEEEAALKALKAVATQHDQDEIWGDDCIEIFIDPANKRDSYYQIIVNSKGVFWDAWHDAPNNPDKSWNPGLKVAAKVGAKSWTCELAIPLAAFTHTAKTEAEWAFNVSRSRTAAGESTYWSPVYNDSSHHPEKFGRLLGMPALTLKK